MMMTPALVVVVGALLYPLAFSLWTSLSSVNPADLSFRFVGLRNYVEASREGLFAASLLNTLAFAVITITATVVIGLAMALVLREPFRGRAVLRTVVILPWAVSQVVVAIAWGWIYDGTYGLLNAVLKEVGVIARYRGWLSDPHLALSLLAVAFVWSSVPFAAMMYLASLHGIPSELYRAAQVDGAGPLRRFGYVTLPALRHATLVVLVVASVDALLAFTLIYTMTGGGPGTATTVLSWLGYQITFVRLELGEGAAMFYVLVLLMIGSAALYIWLLRQPGQPRGRQ